MRIYPSRDRGIGVPAYGPARPTYRPFWGGKILRKKKDDEAERTSNFGKKKEGCPTL